MKRDKNSKISASDRVLLKNLLSVECRFLLQEDMMDELIDLGSVIEVSSGETVCNVGQFNSNIYIVISGIICRWRWNKNKEVVDTFSTPGTMFMEYHSYYASKEAHAFFEACCPSRLLRISARDFDGFIERSHTFARWVLNMAHCQLFYYELRDLDLNGSVLERYETLMRQRPEIIKEVPLKTVAAYLGVSPQYLSTLRKEWLLRRNNRSIDEYK